MYGAEEGVGFWAMKGLPQNGKGAAKRKKNTKKSTKKKTRKNKKQIELSSDNRCVLACTCNHYNQSSSDSCTNLFQTFTYLNFGQK